MKNFIQQFKNARKYIKECKQGLWTNRQHITYHEYMFYRTTEFTLCKDGLEVWYGNGPWFCELHEPKNQVMFGLFWRHWVWYRTKKYFREANKKEVYKYD